MEKEKLLATLKSLATGNARSETARLRDVFEHVEGALKSGVSRSAVLEALHQQGFSMKLRSFESAMYRIRKKVRKCGPQTHNQTLKIGGFKVSTPSPQARIINEENDLLK